MKQALFGLLAISLLAPFATLAFDPDYLLSDWDLEDGYALDLDQIQHFLDRGYLGDYETEDWEGTTMSAAEIIWQASTDHDISPKFLLVLLQKEQSLVEDDNPTDSQLDWATGYAVCDSCAKDDPAIQRWKGFGKQVNSAALQFREGYLADIEETGTTQGKYGPGVDVQIDDTTVTPTNAATAALYAYTPHLHGNENFVEIWHDWFETIYPTGTLLSVAGESGVYLIEYGYKRPIHSWSALLSRFNPDLIIEVGQDVLANYAEGRPIDFPNYSILQDEDGHIYLLVDDALRHFDSMDTFHSLGFMEDEITPIDNDDLDSYDVGEPVTSLTVDPDGDLLQLSTNGAIYYVQNGYRHPILSSEIYELRFSSSGARMVEPVEVEQYREGSPVLLPDGHLVIGPDDPTVYVISDGERLPIASESAFTSFGWSWDDIVAVSEVALNLHDIGETISVDY